MPPTKSKNEHFFREWAPRMAYVLGFFAADGNLTINPRGSRYIEFTSCDKSVIEGVRKSLGSENKIGTRKGRGKEKDRYRLQIGSKKMFGDLENLGMSVAKSKTLQFPSVPTQYLSHFVLGYFDGDGNVVVTSYKKKGRKNRSKTILSGFTCGSRSFLVTLQEQLKKHAGIDGGTLFKRDRAFRLYFSVNDSRKLYTFMYTDDSVDFYLKRKKRIFKRFFKN